MLCRCGKLPPNTRPCIRAVENPKTPPSSQQNVEAVIQQSNTVVRFPSADQDQTRPGLLSSSESHVFALDGKVSAARTSHIQRVVIIIYLFLYWNTVPCLKWPPRSAVP